MAAAKTLPEIIAEKRQEALEGLARVPDNEPMKAVRIKGRLDALDDLDKTLKDQTRANRDPDDIDKER